MPRPRHVLGARLIAVRTLRISAPTMYWRARALDISESDASENVMLKETADGEFTTVQDRALRSFRVRPALKMGVNDRVRALSSCEEGPMRPTQRSPWRRLRPSRVDVQTADGHRDRQRASQDDRRNLHLPANGVGGRIAAHGRSSIRTDLQQFAASTRVRRSAEDPRRGALWIVNRREAASTVDQRRFDGYFFSPGRTGGQA